MKATAITNLSAVVLLVGLSVGATLIYQRISAIGEEQKRINESLLAAKRSLAEREESNVYLATTAQELATKIDSYVGEIRHGYRSLNNRLTAIETRLQGQSEQSDSSQNLSDPGLKPKEDSDPVVLSPELLERADKVGFAASLTNFTFDSLIDSLVRNGILPESFLAEGDDIKDSVRQHFEIFLAAMQAITARKRLSINKIIDEFNVSENYVELPINASKDDIKEKVPPRKGGVMFLRKYPALGVQRHYHFSFDEHPELLEQQNMMEEARSRMINDIYEYGQSLKAKQQ
jgi:hypothetical protein